MKPSAAKSAPEVLTLAQAAELLQLCTKTVGELAASGKLPGRRVGRDWRFVRTTILRWIDGDHPAQAT